MRRTPTALVLLCTLALLTACRVEPTPRPDVTAPADIARAEIQKLFAEYQQALLAGDARRAASVFTADAHVYEAGLPDRMGRGEIHDALAASLRAATVTYIANESEAIDVTSDGIAYDMGTFEERIRDGEEDERTVRGRYAARWIRGAEAAWRINRLMLYALPTDTAAPADTTAS